MNFDDILSGSNKEQNNYNHKPFNKDEWVKRKNEERKELYDLIDKTADEIKVDPTEFKAYLDAQATFDKYSVGNALLITAQMPTATQIKDYDGWQEVKAFVKKNPQWIKILEPGDSYQRADGSMATSYNPKRMLDISQTSAKPVTKANSYDDKTMLKAFLHESPVDVKAVDDLPNGKGAEWNKEDNVLYVRRGLEAPVIFNALSLEIARAGLEETGNKELDDFKCYCTSYLVCKKHGIDVSSYRFDNLPESLKQMNINEVRNELGSIRGAMEDINTRMGQYFESIAKTQKNREYER